MQRFADPRRDLRVAAEAGLYFLRLLERFKVSVAGAAGARRRAAAPAARGAARPTDDDAGRRYLAVMRGRVPDGYRVYQALAPTLRPARARRRSCRPRRRSPPPTARRRCRPGIAFLDWFDARYSIAPAGAGAPSATPTWISERLEYSFAVSAKTSDGELGLTAAEYPGGALEWHSFDVDPGLHARREAGRPEAASRSCARSFPRRCATRAWRPTACGSSRTAQVNLNRIEGDPDELLRLLLVEFALAYGNDWFTIPVDVDARRASSGRSRSSSPTRSASARSSRTTPLARARRPSGGCSRSARPPGAAREDALFLPPVLAASLHGDPVEEVLFIRDELSNLVWAVERLAPSIAGGALDRAERYRDAAARPGRRSRRTTRPATRATASRRPCPTTGSRSSRSASTRASPTSASGAPRR